MSKISNFSGNLFKKIGKLVLIAGAIGGTVLSVISHFGHSNNADFSLFGLLRNPFIIIYQPFVDGFMYSNWLTLQIGYGGIALGLTMYVLGDKIQTKKNDL